ncbi:MAG: C4-type zinc ribbon domain-containing protein [Candidatus Eremiobacteraeota bacterium]|nr:C4-type zinc ribbon domain-containing protein [Candidatus Eremiobacteraeota bacterium]
MSSQIWQLYRIQLIDNQIADMAKKIENLTRGEELLEELGSLEKSLEEMKQELKKRQTTYKDKDLECKKYISQKEGFEKKLYSGQIASHKELESWQAEVQNLKKKQSDLDDELLAMLDELDEREKSIGEQEALLGEKKAEHQRAGETYQERLDALNAEVESLKQKREKMEQTVEKSLIKQFTELQEQREGIAVVKVLKGICGGCYMNLPETSLKRIQARDLEFCSNCGRILFADGE